MSLTGEAGPLLELASQVPCSLLGPEFPLHGRGLEPLAPLLPSPLTPSPLRGLKDIERSRFKADQAWGGRPGLRRGVETDHWQGLGSTCCLQVLGEGRGSGGLLAASGTGLAVPAETLTGRGGGAVATVPWGDLLRSLGRRSKDSSSLATSWTPEAQPPPPADTSSWPRTQGLPSWTARSHHSPATSTMSPGTMSRALILCTDFLSAR